MDQTEHLKVAFITPEMAPLAKTGGLADVTGALPKYLSRSGQLEVTVWLPFYREIKKKNLNLKLVATNLKLDIFPAESQKNFSIFEYQTEDFKVYLVQNDFYFDRDYLYGTPEGDYPDNGHRFAFFCLAALTGFKLINWIPDLIHAHDWQSALTLAYLKHVLATDGLYQKTRSLFTIHNLAYQGLFPPEILGQVGLPGYLFNPEDMEFYGRVNYLKAGLLYSEAISTVSPTYSQEIQTPEFGFGLDGVLRKRSERLFGILNGIDYQEWNPATDPALPAHYSRQSPAGKFLCRQELLRSFNFDAQSKQPIVGLVSRLAGQKGFDLLVKSLDEILKRDLYLIILGTGEKKIQDMLIQAVRKYPQKLGLKIAFDDRLARLIYAGSDFFLIPSRYEPCGLTQMYSLRYGTIPIVRSTGGLKDSVQEFNPQRLEGNGFLFEEYETLSLLAALDRALGFYQQKPFWAKLKDNAFRCDFSWEKSALNYYELYLKILRF
ncbi:MAG TPA: glycogen synthase GlgA [Candidatus Saccharicenans sp.]|jgi:starch synthase|nr:glycogen synthase GlgA [Candidatus Saccharicenans sp.]HRD01119.1 glycogen synthase GlgA [Candidatus Saccharicenans sp.]